MATLNCDARANALTSLWQTFDDVVIGLKAWRYSIHVGSFDGDATYVLSWEAGRALEALGDLVDCELHGALTELLLLNDPEDRIPKSLARLAGFVRLARFGLNSLDYRGDAGVPETLTPHQVDRLIVQALRSLDELEILLREAAPRPTQPRDDVSSGQATKRTRGQT